jgi:hypothetical protein
MPLDDARLKQNRVWETVYTITEDALYEGRESLLTVLHGLAHENVAPDPADPW